MFSRVYLGMFLSVVFAALGCFLVYQYSATKRNQDYQIANLTSMVALIADRYSEQAEQDRATFLDLVAQLSGAQIQSRQSEQVSQRVLSQLEQKNITYQVADDQIVWWFGDNNQYIQFELEQVNERVFRAHALLLAAELQRKQQTPNLAQLQLYSFGELQLVNLAQLRLDPQFMSRLYRQSVVVDYGDGSAVTVFTPMAENKVLIMGPLPSFTALPNHILLIMLGLTASIIIFTAYVLVRRMELRIGVIVDFVNNLAKGDLSSRTALKGKDQFAHLASRVNSMAVQIEELMLNQKEMLQAISHDLRTPIARIRFRLDMLVDEAETEQIEEKTEAIKKDIEELEQLISQVLTHMKLSQSDQLLTQPIELQAVISALLDEQAIAFPQANFTFDHATNAPLQADPLMLKRLLQNLVTNAAKHCRQEVKVELSEATNKMVIKVHDDGEGIAAELRTKIFEPFFRIDSSRNRKTGGYGLGLSIIKKIADLHDAKVTVDESPLGGAVFVAEFPIIETK